MTIEGKAFRNDAQIDLAAVETFERLGGVLFQSDLDARRLAGDVGQEIEQQYLSRKIRGDDADAPIRRLRIERRRRRDQRLGLEQDIVQRLGKRPRQRRRLHAPADRNNEFVVKMLAQPGQRPAERRLTEIKLFRGAGDILVRQQRIERDKQIQVETVKACCSPSRRD